MRASRGEIKIEEILDEAGLNFKEEYSFPHLNSPNGRPLRFDFVIFDDDGQIDFIIEYQVGNTMKLVLSSVVSAVFINSNITIIRNGGFAHFMILD